MEKFQMNPEEIEFRGQKKGTKEWVFGNLFVPNKLVEGLFISPNTTYVDFAPGFEDGDNYEERAKDGCVLGRFLKVTPETVGQYIGMKDKSEEPQRIYKDNIIKANGIYHVIIFEKSAFRSNKEDYSLNSVYFQGSEFLKVGNIHDNPELMEY